MFRPPPTRPSLHDSSSSEDEEDQLLREEQEQERLLSEQHGEASEEPANGASRKRQSDAEIADALNSNDASVKKKKPRLRLTEEKLTGADGLIRVRHEFTSKARYRQPNPINMKHVKDKKVAKRKQFERDVKASAQYVSKLMNCYREFALDVAPNMHYNDTFLRIQELGKKKLVREYLESMRLEICREQLEKQHGREKAEKYLHELDHGLTLSRDEYGDDMMFEDVGGIGTRRSTNLTEGLNIEEQSSPTSDGTSAPPQVEIAQVSSAVDSPRNHESSDDDDNGDENELSFDDVTPPDTQPNFSQFGNSTIGRGVGNESVVKESGIENLNAGDESERTDELANMELEEPRADEDDVTTDKDLVQKTSDKIGEEDLEEPHASDADDRITATNTAGDRDESSDESSDTRKEEVLLESHGDSNGEKATRAENDKAIDDTSVSDKEGFSNDHDSGDDESPSDPVSKDSNSCDHTEHDESNGTKLDENISQQLDTQPQYNSEESTQGSNKLVIIPQPQETMTSDDSKVQSWQMTQDSIVFDGTQRSLLTQESEGGTQDTLVFDSSQAVEAFVDHSQDY